MPTLQIRDDLAEPQPIEVLTFASNLRIICLFAGYTFISTPYGKR